MEVMGRLEDLASGPTQMRLSIRGVRRLTDGGKSMVPDREAHRINLDLAGILG